MKITERVEVTRELFVAPCLSCGGTDILLNDSGYSSFNIGGGQCKTCGRESREGNLSCYVSMDTLANIWNRENDISRLIEAQETIIKDAKERIKNLKKKPIQKSQK